ncbi:MAG: hypothetical protein HZB51_01940 [Chloroflexi bacterium]|nr:hypothetical protein [Chloroflexota bacterium]
MIDNIVIAAGHEVFVQSDDGGVNWKFIPTNLPDQDIHGFAVSSSNPHTFFAQVVNYGLWRSDDAGATWTIVSKELPDSALALAVVPTSPETLYAATMDKGCSRASMAAKPGKPHLGLIEKSR